MFQQKDRHIQPVPERGVYERRSSAVVGIVNVAAVVVQELDHIEVAFGCCQDDTAGTGLVSVGTE
jgi:hypothetical protein